MTTQIMPSDDQRRLELRHRPLCIMLNFAILFLTLLGRLSESPSSCLFTSVPDLSRLRPLATSRPNILYPKIHEVDLWQV